MGGQHDIIRTLVANSSSADDIFYLLRRQMVSSILDPRFDLDKECGYLPTIGPENYRQMYDREGVATRLVDMMPDDCWQESPSVKQSEDSEKSPWEEAFEALDKAHHIWHYLHRLDAMSGIGHYGVLLIGLNDGKDLSEPAAGLDTNGKPTAARPKQEILYLKPFDESLVTINLWDSDPASARCGLPIQYRIQFFDPRTERPEGTGMAITSHTVHWTRIHHAADDRLSSDVFGRPRLKNVWNYLMGIRKILGGSAEMFWKGGFPGLAFEVDPSLGDTTVPLNQDKLKAQMDAYANGMSRYLAVAGVSVKSLAPQIADPTASLKAQLTAISIAKAIPIAKLIGSEKSGLGGKDEDETETWNKKLTRRNNQYTTPWIVRPFIDRLMALGVLETVDDYNVVWPDLNTVSDGDIADTCLKQTQALAAYVGGGCSAAVPPTEFFSFFMKLSDEQIETIEKETKAFVGIDENRNMELGLNPDGSEVPSPMIVGKNATVVGKDGQPISGPMSGPPSMGGGALGDMVPQIPQPPTNAKTPQL